MEPSVSLILPVRNAQSRLAREVPDLLEMLSELAVHFEIIIVDDGSNDRTEEIGIELAHDYPQVRFTSHRKPLGMDNAAKTGLSLATGDMVFLQEENRPVNLSELMRLWSCRNDDRLAVARLEPDPSPLSPEMVTRLAAWGATLKHHAARHAGFGGMQMIRVDGIRQLAAGASAGYYRSEAGGPHQHSGPKFLNRLAEAPG